MQPCPCQSGLNYQACCGVFHSQLALPSSAEQLMRSRYSAYVLGLIDYIVETTVPAQQEALDVDLIQQWSSQSHWLNLEIIQSLDVGSRHSTVEFKAYFTNKLDITQAVNIHHEHSAFVKTAERWYFIDPTLQQYPTMKQPCFCGSGKKFKQCCAVFLKD